MIRKSAGCLLCAECHCIILGAPRVREMTQGKILHFCSSWCEKTELTETRTALESVTEALLSVLSEDGVKEYLSAYVMGVELIERASRLDSAKAKNGDEK